MLQIKQQGPQQPPVPPQLLMQRTSRPQSHHVQSIKVPANIQGNIPPECLVPRQIINIGQPQRQVPVLYSRSSFSVSRNPSVGRQVETITTLPPNSLKVISPGQLQQMLQRIPVPSTRQLVNPLHTERLPSHQEIPKGLSTPIRHLDNLLDDFDE